MYHHFVASRNIEDLEEFLTKGRREDSLSSDKERKWTPLEPAEKASYVRDIYVAGLSEKEDSLVELAKKHDVKVDNELLLHAVVRQDEELFRGLVEQLDMKEIDWKRILTALLEDAYTLHFYQHIIDTYLGDKWAEFLPNEEDICSDANAYIALLKRCFKAAT